MPRFKPNEEQKALVEQGFCGRKNRSYGKPRGAKYRYCHDKPYQGIEGGACARHGGKSPKGVASPHWQGKGFSKYLPPVVLEAFRAIVEDPRYSFDPNLGLLEGLLADRMKALLEGTPTSKLWKELGGVMARARRARDQGDATEVARCLRDVDRIVGDGERRAREEESIREEVRKLVKERRLVVRSQHRVEHEREVSVSLKELVAARARLLEIIAKHVTDRDAVRGIVQDLREDAKRLGGHGREAFKLLEGGKR